MKRVFTVVLCFFFAISASAAEYFVAPDGSDRADGSAAAPFLTIERARDQIRADKKAGKAGPWIVTLAAGEFALTEPLVFTAEDSGVVYRGSAEGETVLSGGVELTGWQTADEPGVWVAQLPKLEGRTLYFEQLFLNGRRLTRARYPDANPDFRQAFLNPKSVKQTYMRDQATRKETKPSTPQYVEAREGQLDLLRGVPEKELRWGQLVIHHHWDSDRRMLLGFDSKTQTVRMQGTAYHNHNPWRDSSMYYIENVRTAFNQPGEWFYDGEAGKIFYRPLPGETLETSRFVVPRPGLKQLLLLHGESLEKQVTDIRFERLTFSYTDSPRRQAVMEVLGLPQEITGDLAFPGPTQFNSAQTAAYTEAVADADFAERITWERCTFSHFGEYAVWLRSTAQCTLRRCTLTDLGGGGIRIGFLSRNTDHKTFRSEKHLVENCTIRGGGRIHASAVGVWLGHNAWDNTVRHCEIADFYYSGVSMGWVWGYVNGTSFRNTIEFNRIHNIGQGRLADMAGVYTLGLQTGSRVCNNVIYDVQSYSYGGWGLYPDEGTEGILMENNLVYDTMDGSFHQHYGKENLIRNNIFVRSAVDPLRFAQNPKLLARQICISRPEPHISIIFENNIVYWTAGGTALSDHFDRPKSVIHKNLWWNADGAVDFNGLSHEDWVKSGKDAGGVVADPLFYDAAKNDFRLREDSPALKIGFRPFDYSTAGVEAE